MMTHPRQRAPLLSNSAGQSTWNGVAGGAERHRQSLLLLAAPLICLLSSWYFALVVVPAALGVPTVQEGLLPEWIGCREILLYGHDPYRSETTARIQQAIYGRTLSSGEQALNQHRFAYPVFLAFLFFPLALLPFASAQWVVLLAGIILTALSVALWLWRQPVGNLDRLGALLFTLASYPVVLALQLRQPTIVIAALLALVVFWARSGNLVRAGMLAALCCAKPQVTIAVLLPLTIWSLAAWRTRKAFLLSLSLSVAALFFASELLVPVWLPHWLSTLHAYAHYAGSRPLLADLCGEHLFVPAGCVLLGSAIWVSLLFRDSDLWLAISFSIATFQLLFPFQVYNEALLLPAALWIAVNAGRVEARSQLCLLLSGCTWIVLGSGWVSAIALLGKIIAPAQIPPLWQGPLVSCYLYPFALLPALAAHAVARAAPLSRVTLTQQRQSGSFILLRLSRSQ